MRDTLIVFGAFTLLATIGSTILRSSLDSSDQKYRNEVRQIALTTGQQLLEQVASADYDEQTVGSATFVPDSALTPAIALGPELGETRRDDVDDYNNYTTLGDTTRYKGYTLRVRVKYADPSNPMTESSIPTHMKRISVTVANQQYLSSPIELSTIVSYY